jgi:hypothetical protein
MKHFAYIAVAASALALSPGAAATSYPDRPVRTLGVERTADIAPDDRLRHRPIETITPVVQSSSVGDGFDWVDAGIGAGGMAGVVLLGAGTALILRRRQQPAFS